MVLEFLIVFVCSVLSLLYGGYTIKKILEEPQGSDRMVEIASAIQEGAQAYLNRQYFTISIVGIVIAILLFTDLFGARSNFVSFSGENRFKVSGAT